MDMCDLFEMDLNEAICSLVPLDGLAGTDDTQTIVLISTPAQLLNGANASLCGHHFGIFVDGTHGMVLEEAQIVLIGTQDIRQKGHRIAAVIVPKAGLNTDLMACIFRHLKALVEAMAMARIGGEECPPGYEWMVSSLLSDDEGCFRKAAKIVFGEGTVGRMCSFHVMKAIKTTGKSKLTNIEHIDEIVEDVRIIQRCTEPNIKAALLKLFTEKWDAEGETDFIK